MAIIISKKGSPSAEIVNLNYAQIPASFDVEPRSSTSLLLLVVC
jgi:hypothetical protein